MNIAGYDVDSMVEGNIQEIIEIMSVINEGNRMRILDHMKSIHPSGDSFKMIVLACSIKPTLLVYHMKVLQKNGLIEKGFLEEEGRRDHTRYKLTEKGLDIWSSADLLEIGRSRKKKNGIHDVGCPDVISFIPMEIGPRSFMMKEV